MDTTIDETLKKGVKAHEAGRIQEADKYYTAVLKIQPKHPDANHNMGILGVGLGKHEQALPFLKTATESNPYIEQFWVSYIRTLIKIGSHKKAKSIVKQARRSIKRSEELDQLAKMIKPSDQRIGAYVEGDPAKHELQPLIDLLTDGQFEKCLALTDELLESFPNSVSLHKLQGIAFSETGQYDNAIQCLERTVALNPRDAEALNNLGLANKNNGSLDDAIQSFQKATQLKSDYAEAYNNLGLVQRARGESSDAVYSYQRAIQINPSLFEPHNNLGNTLKEMGKLDLAIKSYEKALEIFGDSPEVHNNIGAAFKSNGDIERAIQSFEKAIKLKPDFAEAHNNLGSVMHALGNSEMAVNCFKRALEIKPDCAGPNKHILNALSGVQTSSAPREYIESLFDGYAQRFESSLVDSLDYRIPAKLSQLLIQKCPQGSVRSVMDLGCGTGLAGIALRESVKNLEGIDVSQAMLKEAREKNVYDKLIHMDIVEYLSFFDLNYDCFIASDVFIYVGELSQVFSLIASRNSKTGKLAFSTEHIEHGDFFLEPSGRYSHSKSYIESLCKKFGMRLSYFTVTNLRKEKNDFIHGGLYVLDF